MAKTSDPVLTNLSTTTAPPQEAPVEVTETVTPTAPKKMDEKQLRKELKKLMQENSKLNAQVDQLKMVCNQLAEQYKNCDQAYNDLRHTMKQREAYLKRVINTAADTANMMEVAHV